MSGFRKFRTTQQRRRKAELLELGHLRPGGAPGGFSALAQRPATGMAVQDPPEAEIPADFSPSAEAQEIGPPPIAWLKTRRVAIDH